MPDQPQLIDPDTAYATVTEKVYAPVFFEKVAKDYGLTFDSQEEQFEALTMATQLRQAHDAQQAQQPTTASLLKQAHEHLNKTLGDKASETESSLDGSQIKQAAANASFDPELSAAVLSLQTHAAQAMAEQA